MLLYLLRLAWVTTVLAPGGSDQPLPNAQQLKQRVMASMKASEKSLENYSCLVNEEVDELNADGSVKRHKTKEEDRFFVNGFEIDHVLKRDGKALEKGDAKKEQERVDKEVKKYSDRAQADKASAKGEKQADMVLRALRFENGHRETRAGRETIAYELSGDPAFHPKNIEERFLRVLSGHILLDEETGNLLALSVHTNSDVKIAGGLIANVHKGFQFNLQQERQPDGVWLTNAVDGSGDMRAGLFLHPRFHFKERLAQCHLFSVNTNQTIQTPEAAKP